MLSGKIISRLALCLVTLGSLAEGAFPVVDRARGNIEKRPYCPPRPASPEFQRDAFTEFINEFFAGQVKESLEAFVSEDYIQHNPYVLSGRDNAIAALASGGTGPVPNVTVLQTLFDSPFGSVHYKLEVAGQPPSAVTDIWRFNGTCIMEHWDMIQALPANATNPLALF